MASAKDEPGAEPLLAEADAAFDALTGGEADAVRNLASLTAALEKGRLAHALLFAGPSGAGKRHCAVGLARRLRCSCWRQPVTGASSCAACERVLRGLDQDVMLVAPVRDPKRRDLPEIGIGRIRTLQERLTFTSGGSRVVIVDPADRLSLVAQDSLLKTLEEPPPGVVIVLLTTRPSHLKPTVRSRCQLVRFRAPSREVVARLVAETQGVGPEQAELAAALAGGDVRRALELDGESAAAEWLELARGLYEVLGPRGEERSRQLAVDAVPRKGDDAVGGDLGGWLDLLDRILRDVMLAGAGVASAELAHPAGETAVRALAERFPAEAARAMDEVERARADLRLHMSAKVTLTGLLLSLHGLAVDAARAASREART